MNNQSLHPPKPVPLIFRHQRAAFDHLLSVARACFGMQRKSLPLRPRTNTLLVGPSGSGKNHLARAVAEASGAAFLALTAGQWIVLGANGRGAAITWSMIYCFLKRHENAEGVVILLDEIDKLSGGPGSSTSSSGWGNYLKVELFSLLDLTIPTGLTDDEGNPMDEESLFRAQKVLSERTLILGAGAFQHIWEKRSRPTLGFAATNGSEGESTDLNLLAETLGRETSNRFRSQLVVLPQLIEADYRRMLEMVGAQVPHYLRETFLRLGNDRIADALHNRQGCRYVEELLLDTIIQERAAVQVNHTENTTGNPTLKQPDYLEPLP